MRITGTIKYIVLFISVSIMIGFIILYPRVGKKETDHMVDNTDQEADILSLEYTTLSSTYFTLNGRRVDIELRSNDLIEDTINTPYCGAPQVPATVYTGVFQLLGSSGQIIDLGPLTFTSGSYSDSYLHQYPSGDDMIIYFSQYASCNGIMLNVFLYSGAKEELQRLTFLDSTDTGYDSIFISNPQQADYLTIDDEALLETLYYDNSDGLYHFTQWQVDFDNAVIRQQRFWTKQL